MVMEYLPVVADVAEVSAYEHCLLMIQDPDTPAEYVKLQCVFNGYQFRVREENLPAVCKTDQ